ncbi:MAG: hypothetical protein ACYTFN_14725 [Planctomycetota bacterium]|jgi:hypothetical protein
MGTERLTQDDFERLLSVRDVSVYIETGLWRGEQLVVAANHFAECHGIELDPHWHKVTSDAVSARGLEHVEVHFGDTREVLPRLLDRYHDRPCFILLDAHFCKISRRIPKTEFPLWDELELLRERKVGDVIVVDDVHTFGRKRKDAPGWHGVTTKTVCEFLGDLVQRSQVVKDGFVVWTRTEEDDQAT